MMWKAVLAGTTALALVGSSIVYAQQRSGDEQRTRWQPSQEDMAAFAAARIAGLKAGLTLNAEQEKHWPAFEAALKDLSRYRAEQRAARRDAQPPADPTERLRRHADRLSGYGAALKKLADAQEPLYSSLDEAQKRRFAILARPMGRGGARQHHHGMRHGMWRGPERDGGMRGGEGPRRPRWQDRGEQGGTRGEGERL
jgi:zinc resistance-associated protein